jgi:hypothetical protein
MKKLKNDHSSDRVTACNNASYIGLLAQTKAVAKVPFDFTVSSVEMPAGEYTLQRAP